MSKRDITGQRFGKLTCVRKHSKDNDCRWLWLFKCDCGGEVIRSSLSVTRTVNKGSSPSCGCEHPLKTHGLSNAYPKLYDVWKAMRQRCRNPGNKDFKNYGGRGISICAEWDDFAKFHRWAVGSGYCEGVTIERVDVNGNYCPDNCTWIPNERQALNTRRIRTFEYKGEHLTARQLAEIAGVGVLTMKARLTHYGWDVERAVTEEAFKGKNQTYKRGL